MTTSIDVEGNEQLAATLSKAADDIGSPTGALEKSGHLVETRGKGYAPVDTGALANSITATVDGTEVRVGTSVGVYAGVQEYGSATTPAHPYMRPALDYSSTVVVEYFKDDVEQALRKVKGA